ncbi:MAG: helix-turn-helix domain-containing protein [Rhodobacteraceae bacterium]|nr:helix-turn-helix domain-containing protein [Paracoccaceae bacterium]
MQSDLGPVAGLPGWLPDAVKLYLHHTEEGLSLRALARRDGRHASTVMRLVRRYERRRDDPLLDEALAALAPATGVAGSPQQKDTPPMSAPIRPQTVAPHTLVADEATLEREGRRILRRLAEPGAVLAIAPDLEKAVVMREFPDGRSARTGVMERAIAQAFALKDWITCRKAGRVSSYEITTAGRAALKRMIDADDRAKLASGLAEAPMAFADQHRIWGERDVAEEEGPRRVRHNLAESPVAVLGRRRDKDGKPFLEEELVEAAERLREDFELAQMGPKVAQNWERFLTGGDRGSYRADNRAEGPRDARDRVALALRDLGPGLGDVALRVCCFLEGIETAERRMGWAARSGKIVLRIALQRLRRHYDETYGRSGPLIG